MKLYNKMVLQQPPFPLSRTLSPFSKPFYVTFFLSKKCAFLFCCKRLSPHVGNRAFTKNAVSFLNRVFQIPGEIKLPDRRSERNSCHIPADCLFLLRSKWKAAMQYCNDRRYADRKWGKQDRPAPMPEDVYILQA